MINLKDITVLDLFAMFAPEPTEEQILLQQKLDHQRNPHNDGPPKPRIRERLEIIAELKFEYGKAMLNQSRKYLHPEDADGLAAVGPYTQR